MLKGNDLLEGIVNLLDRIQDEAAEQIGERAVFGFGPSGPTREGAKHCRTCKSKCHKSEA